MQNSKPVFAPTTGALFQL